MPERAIEVIFVRSDIKNNLLSGKRYFLKLCDIIAVENLLFSKHGGKNGNYKNG